MEINKIDEEELMLAEMAANQPPAERDPATEQIPIDQIVLTPEQAADPMSQVVPPVDNRATPQDPTGALTIGTQAQDISINAYQDVKYGTQQELEAKAQAQEEEASLASQAVQAKGQINKAYQDKILEINNEKAKATENYHEMMLNAGKEVDPNRWWNSLKTGQKIRAGIAQLMAGIGGNKVNPIGSAIKADIEAQKEAYSRGGKQGKGIYDYFKNKGKSDMEAAGLSYASSLKQVKGILDAEVLKLKPGQTRSRIMKESGKVAVELGKYLSKERREALDRAQKQKKLDKEGRIHLEGSTLKRYETSDEIVTDLESMISLLEKGSHISSYVPGKDTAYTAAARNVADLILRDRSGAVAGPEEKKELKKMLARIAEGSDFQIDKLTNLKRKFQKKMNIMLRGTKGGIGKPLQLEKVSSEKYKLKKPGFSKGKVRLRKTNKKR